MASVLLLDLGGTLVDGQTPFPHVPEALAALRRFEDLQVAVVSDFTAAVPPTKANVARLFAEYLALLDGFGLRKFFQPAARRVTLSTQAGVNKPDRRVYELAVARLGAGAALAQCLTITEDAAHVAACRALGMSALRFGTDFVDWSEGPLLVRRLGDVASGRNTGLAVGVWLAAHEGVTLVSLEGEPTAAAARFRARRAGEAPRHGSVVFAGDGRVASLAWDR